jgi:hypothetical protein
MSQSIRYNADTHDWRLSGIAGSAGGNHVGTCRWRNGLIVCPGWHDKFVYAEFFRDIGNLPIPPRVALVPVRDRAWRPGFDLTRYLVLDELDA